MQPGFFDLEERLEKLSEMGDPLEELNKLIDWEIFRPILERVRQDGELQGGSGGRPPYDVVLMFKVLILQGLHNLSDRQVQKDILKGTSKNLGICTKIRFKVPVLSRKFNFRPERMEFIEVP